MKNLEQLKQLASHFFDTGLNALINNAGIFTLFSLNDYNEEIFTKNINTNVKGPIFLVKLLTSALEKRQGSITNISSIITQTGIPNTSMYTTTKGALEALTKALALDLAPHSIRINAVLPGAVDTPIFKKLGMTDQQAKAAMDEVSQTIPLKRYAQPKEIAHVIAAQIESTYTTGSLWVVDGGVAAN